MSPRFAGMREPIMSHVADSVASARPAGFFVGIAMHIAFLEELVTTAILLVAMTCSMCDCL